MLVDFLWLLLGLVLLFAGAGLLFLFLTRHIRAAEAGAPPVRTP